jgi:uncharacterized protein YlxW (UPF0749 family)
MRPPSRTQTRIALVAVSVAVGLLVGVQVVRQDAGTARLAAESPDDLTRILAELNTEADELARQIAELQVKLFRYEDTAERDRLAVRDARKTLRDLRVLAGTTDVRGPGLAVTIADRRGRVTWEPFLDLVQELRDAGAEAIAVNDLRIVASSWFGPAEAGVTVDGQETGPPYRVEAIGSSDDIAEALEIPGGPLSLIRALLDVQVTVELERDLRVPALKREISFRYARPAS